MATLDHFRSQGWHITSEGLNKLCDNEANTDTRLLIRKALDLDLRDIGAPVIASEINKNIFGPVVLQIVKIKNISAPKSKPKSQTAPRMIKLILTDGHANCQGVEIDYLPSISVEKTIPGTKILIDRALVISSCILLSPDNCKILGGSVRALVEKWELSKLMPTHVRITDDGPPSWVNFGKKILNATATSPGFKSLEQKNKDQTKENSEFQVQRQDAIAEATQGAVKKVFGGGVKPPQTFNAGDTFNTTHSNRSETQRVPRANKAKGKEKNELEKVEKPSQRVSLFDFLEDKLPPTEINHQSKPNFNFKPAINDMPQIAKSKIDYTRNKSSSSTSFSRDNNKPKFLNNNFSNGNNTRSLVDSEFRPKTNMVENNHRFQNDKPPRFQKQHKQESAAPKFSNAQTEPRNKPNTNNFVDKLTNEINNISLYNSKYETEKLRTPNKMLDVNKPWKWKVGDRCMAKYWEDNKFYNAIVTGITSKTCMVEFIEYGNFEEVLHCDCIPITDEKVERPYSDSVEFRRSRNNRPAYSRNFNKPQGQPQNKHYES